MPWCCPESEPKYDYRGLDLRKPIVATNPTSSYPKGDCILLPVQERSTEYECIGYDWFNIQSGEWGSNRAWDTPQQAIDNWWDEHTIKNIE